MNYSRLYCEDCMVLVQNDRCQQCGAKKLRAPEENDPVYLITKDAITSAAVEDILKQNNIPCQKQGLLGEGIISRIGYTLETYKFFVPFGAYDKSRELLANFFDDDGEKNE